MYQDKALYFNPSNLNQIVKKINQALNLSPVKRQQMIQAGIKHSQQFSWQKTAKKTLAAYQQHLG